MNNRAYIIGNCQAQPLRYILNKSVNFCRLFSLDEFPAVHIANDNDVSQLNDKISKCALIVSQPISESYRKNIGLGTESLFNKSPNEAIKISWPSLYFSAYNPELFKFKSQDGKSVTSIFDYHCKIIFKSFLNDLSISKTCESLHDCSIAKDQSEIANKSLDELKHRDQKTDVKIFDFISQHYRFQRLFWTFNHPSTEVLKRVASQILKFLGLKNDIADIPFSELLDGTIYPILPATNLALKTSFSDDQTYKIRRKKYSQSQIVKKYFEFYNSCPELVEFNSNLLK